MHDKFIEINTGRYDVHLSGAKYTHFQAAAGTAYQELSTPKAQEDMTIRAIMKNQQPGFEFYHLILVTKLFALIYSQNPVDKYAVYMRGTGNRFIV